MKKLMTLLLMALMVTGLQAQSKSGLPNVTLKDLNGKDVNLAEVSNNGKPVIIVFWATWCKTPCVSELDNLNDLYQKWQNETGVRVFAVSMDDSRTAENVKPLAESKGWDFEVLLDVQGSLKQSMNIYSPPVVLLIDGKGNIVYQQGYTEDLFENLYDEILKII